MRFFKESTVLLLTFFTLPLSAQSFEKGTILLANGDTLRGYIQNNEYQKLTYQATFKYDRKGEPVVFQPSEIKAFVFKDGDYFEPFDVSFDVKTANGMQHVSGKRFLFRLEKGGMELFELKDKGQQPLFIRKNKGELQLLCEGKDGQRLYQDILQEAFADCEQMEIPAHIDLTEASIRPLVEDYNDCGMLGEQVVIPFMQVWGFVGISTNLFFNNYKGYNKGLSLELKPVRNGLLRCWNIGLEGQLLEYKKHKYNSDIQHYKIEEIAVKTRFFLPVKKSMANPYGFIGKRWQRFEQERFYLSPTDGSMVLDDRQIWMESSWQIGVGVNANVKRHVFRFEMSFDTYVEMRLGYGYVIR